MKELQKIEYEVGSNHTINSVLETLSNFGYEIVQNIESSAEASKAGGNIQIFPVNFVNPIRLEFFGDNIDAIVEFDKSSNKKIRSHNFVDLNKNTLTLDDNSAIRPGDFIVHEDHGIGEFRYRSARIIADEIVHYVNISYLNNALLCVPSDQIPKISRYIGVGRAKPKLSRLGSPVWKKTYQKTYENALLLAKELLIVYAKRHIARKTPRYINYDWENEVEKTFRFAQTPDQNAAIKDVYSDMTKNVLMDRLICGDVGFGKTEVAIRAAVQAVANGFQVVILVPTTILAEQHNETLRARLKDLPISVEHISRLVEPKIQNEIIEKTKNGLVDILVGTHRLVKGSVEFKNLGLLIIDEEQKFGVKDKEKLKKFREDLDVISLTATPIPRTLYMALSGIREISQIQSVPFGRQSIETAVIPFEKKSVLDYLKNEKARGGQSYYLHNEVATIQSVQKWLCKELPDCKIEAGHGQMSETKLGENMREFAAGEIDILVCSTIIENGLDLPNVNTMIVDEADRFGLSQLYQIRGRIGRSSKKAYGVFTYQNKKLTPNAVRRLKVLAENTELGVGYNFAIEDLEIRGGGNILGKEQHGNMEAVGLMLYSKLLKLAVEKLKKEAA
ncbi:MAG: DEAD/DEAH box helicase [Candidatus Berkelbacteria bacterium]